MRRAHFIRQKWTDDRSEPNSVVAFSFCVRPQREFFFERAFSVAAAEVQNRPLIIGEL